MSLFGCLMVCCALTADGGAGASEEVDALIESFESAIETTRQNLEFACTFVARTGFAFSLEDAMAGRCKFWEGRGVLAKKGIVMRYSYRSHPDAPGNVGSREEYVSTSKLTLFAMAVDKPLVVEIGPRDPATLHLLTPSRAGELWPTHPLEFEGAVDGAPLSRILKDPGKPWRLVRKEVGEDKSGRVVFTFVHEARNGAAQYTHVITFDVKDGLPVIQRREIHCRGECARATNHLQDIIVALSYAKVKGGWLPSHTRRVLGPGRELDMTGEGSEKMGFMIEEWQSFDLGQRLPTPDDFVVTLPEGARVHGAHVRDPSRIDLLAMSEESLWSAEDHARLPATTVHTQPRSGGRWPFVTIGACLLGATLAFLLLLRARRGRMCRA